jgi:hypothetical protein
MLRVPAVWRPVEPRHDRLVATIGHVVDEAPVTAIEIQRLQDAEIASILDVASRTTRGPIEVGDPGIQGMSRIELIRAVQAFIRSDVGELRAGERRTLSLGHLDPHAANAHAALQTELVIGAA